MNFEILYVFPKLKNSRDIMALNKIWIPKTKKLQNYPLEVDMKNELVNIEETE